jgi:hypothetical protein
MGLDVYFHRVARKFEGDKTNIDDFRNFTDEVDNDAATSLRKQFYKILAPLKEAWLRKQTNNYWDNIYAVRYFEFIHKLSPLIAKNYDFKLYPYVRDGIIDLPKLEEMLDKEAKGCYKEYDAYFRKVNFLFAYFQDKGKLVDEYYAFVDKEDVEDIIDRCVKVLKDNHLAHELLPTQSGFFFGGTDYDDYYFHDVQDCLRQMKKYLKLFKDDEGTGYVIFSW